MTETEFTCVIDNRVRNELYSGHVVLRKRSAIRATTDAPGGVRAGLRKDRLELCDVYITPVSGNPRSVHDHFVLYDVTGRGVLILRDPQNRPEERVTCTLWQLGAPLALRVMEELRRTA
jgi:hypothetical protein